MAKKKPAVPNSLQLNLEKGLRIAAWVLAVLHMLICTFRFVLDTTPVQTAEKWLALVLLLSALAYLLWSKVKYPDTFYRIKAFFSAMKSYEQFFMIGLLLWFALTCWIRQSLDGLGYLKGLDWYLLDVAVSALVLFPMMLYAGREKAKLYIDGLLHVVSFAYTVFIGWCLWNLFRLNVVTLPLGGKVGMTSSMKLTIGCNCNITGAISFTFLAVACYMMITQKTVLKVVYGIAAFMHLWVCMLANSRTVFVCVLFLGAAAVFFLLWYVLREKKLLIRLLAAAAAAAAAVLFLFWFRKSAFVWFNAITNFKELAGITGSVTSKIESSGDLNGRLRLWKNSFRIMVSSPDVFFFGVTPAGVTEALKTICNYKKDFAHVHNSILQVGVSWGVPAMIAFVVFIVKMVIDSVRLWMNSKGLEFKKVFMIPVIVASLLLMDMAEAYLYYSAMSSILFLACGALAYTVKGIVKKKNA